MPELEQQLSALADAVEWPATPTLRLRTTAARPRFQSRWALAAVAVLVIIATLLAYTPTRNAIAGWVNLHTSLKRTTIPPPTPSPLPSGTLGSNLGLGTPTTLAEAQTAVGWQILIPAQLGAPDAVYLQMPPDGPIQGEVTLVYRQPAGAFVLVTEARGSVNEDFFGKTVGPDTTVQDLTIDGHTAWWFSGKPHIFVFLDSNNEPRYDTLRLATNTLVIDEEGTIVRIEANISETSAETIAQSLG